MTAQADSTGPKTGGRLAGRRILVTGGASGIGRAAAELFAAEGAHLALLDRDEKLLKEVSASVGAEPVVADLMSRASIETAVEKAADFMGGIDGVVNSAAILETPNLEATTLELWERVMAINLTGTFLVCQLALPWLKASGNGTIVNIASATALVPAPAKNATAYATSKGGVISFSKCIALELAPNVRVNVVCPGATYTPMTQQFIDNPNKPPSVTAFNIYALKRAGKAVEVAQAVLFLTSHESSFVTGTVVTVDGGRAYH